MVDLSRRHLIQAGAVVAAAIATAAVLPAVVTAKPSDTPKVGKPAAPVSHLANFTAREAAVFLGMTWGIASALNDDDASAILTVDDETRARWAMEEFLQKAGDGLAAGGPEPWVQINDRRKVAAFRMMAALIEARPAGQFSEVVAGLTPWPADGLFGVA